MTALSRPSERRNSDVSMADAAGIVAGDDTQELVQDSTSIEGRAVVSEDAGTGTVTQQQANDSNPAAGPLPVNLLQ